MKHSSRVCADCGVGLGRQSHPLCHACKCRIISEVNTPGMDKAISFLMFAVLVAGVVWLVF